VEVPEVVPGEVAGRLVSKIPPDRLLLHPLLFRVYGGGLKEDSRLTGDGREARSCSQRACQGSWCSRRNASSDIAHLDLPARCCARLRTRRWLATNLCQRCTEDKAVWSVGAGCRRDLLDSKTSFSAALTRSAGQVLLLTPDFSNFSIQAWNASGGDIARGDASVELRLVRSRRGGRMCILTAA
jgi:hypothetical protein